MHKQKPLIGITMGDPSGIGPEIVVKALANAGIWKICRPWVIGDKTVLRTAARMIGSPLTVKDYPNLRSGPCPPKTILLLQVKAPPRKLVIQTLKTAASLAIAAKIQAVVTAPIHKSSLEDAGTRYPGHTEYFAAQAGVKDVGMILVGGPLKVMLVTTHIGMRDLPSLITQERVLVAIRLTKAVMQNYFGVKVPRIVVT
ncbi:MAG: PdxA family dehydrogenase, partial [Nitrospiria bacterium]